MQSFANEQRKNAYTSVMKDFESDVRSLDSRVIRADTKGDGTREYEGHKGENRRELRIPRAAVLLPGRSLLAIARSTLLHVRTLRQRGGLLHRHERTTHPGGRVSVLGCGISLAGPPRPAGLGEQARARIPHGRSKGEPPPLPPPPFK